MSASFDGIKYRFSRLFKNTAYDKEKRERRKKANKNGDITDLSATDENLFVKASKAVIKSLEVNVVSDLPTSAGMR
jgi:hypothetical protein